MLELGERDARVGLELGEELQVLGVEEGVNPPMRHFALDSQVLRHGYLSKHRDRWASSGQN